LTDLVYSTVSVYLTFTGAEVILVTSLFDSSEDMEVPCLIDCLIDPDLQDGSKEEDGGRGGTT
jgi:hypothetical protein